MAVSTERTVRNVLIGALQEIAQDGLGFDLPGGNVKPYPLEMVPKELQTDYLTTEVEGHKVARCWAVDVQGHDTPFAMGNIQTREYSVRIIGYYGVDEDPDNYTLLIDHARAVREAIKDLGINLSGTITRILGTQPFAFSVVSSEFGDLYVGEMRLTAERTNPDY